MDIYGTFGWYLVINVPMVQMMVKATMIADKSNREMLRGFIPDIVASYEEYIECEKNPDVDYSKNRERIFYQQKDLDKIVVKKYNNPDNGSFNWHLHRSGTFVKSVANIIIRAKPDLLEEIRESYPQMVAAYMENDWDRCPGGFEPQYNADPFDGKSPNSLCGES